MRQMVLLDMRCLLYVMSVSGFLLRFLTHPVGADDSVGPKMSQIRRRFPRKRSILRADRVVRPYAKMGKSLRIRRKFPKNHCSPSGGVASRSRQNLRGIELQPDYTRFSAQREV